MSDPGARLVQLASHGGGALVLAASDEFFGAKERLVLDGPPSPPGADYTERGKHVDGWETRRTRGSAAPDWCVIRLAAPAVVERIQLDATGFGANAPATWWLEGCDADEADVVACPDSLAWARLVDPRAAAPDGVDECALTPSQRVSHVRLWIAPDGGVARLRLLGRPLIDAPRVADHAGRAELASTSAGGWVAGCSDEAFSSADALGWLTGPATPADGWETRRRREPGDEWVVVGLAAEAEVERVDLDTTHFIGNAPGRVGVDVGVGDGQVPNEGQWHADAATVTTRPHQRHHVALPVPVVGTHVRLRVSPDGGIARVGVHGRITPTGWQRQQLAVLNWAGADHATWMILELCPSAKVAAALLARRPYDDGIDQLQQAADDALAALADDDLVVAADAHPRLGAAGLSGRSHVEQRDVRAGDADVRARLADQAEQYEQRFGFRFLADAPGRSPADLLDELDRRMARTRDEELTRARQELATITRRRIAEWARRPEGTSG